MTVAISGYNGSNAYTFAWPLSMSKNREAQPDNIKISAPLSKDLKNAAIDHNGNKHPAVGRVIPFAADKNLAGGLKVDSAEQEQMLKRVGAKECTTCNKRRYQDGSNDPGVSFKAPAYINPGSAAAAVSAHEQEHVQREQAKAQQEDRRVVSQSVRIFTSICPECGRCYVSGGETVTVTAAKAAYNDASNLLQNGSGTGRLDLSA